MIPPSKREQTPAIEMVESVCKGKRTIQSVLCGGAPPDAKKRRVKGTLCDGRFIRPVDRRSVKDVFPHEREAINEQKGIIVSSDMKKIMHLKYVHKGRHALTNHIDPVSRRITYAKSKNPARDALVSSALEEENAVFRFHIIDNHGTPGCTDMEAKAKLVEEKPACWVFELTDQL